MDGTMSEKERALLLRFTHALMSPLTVILGSAEMLESRAGRWSASSRELLELILSQARRLQETLDGLVATAEVQEEAVRLSWSGSSACPPGVGAGGTTEAKKEPASGERMPP